jgi:hypothetical protein
VGEPLTEPRRVLVLGSCGHWWRETQPVGLRLDPNAPRVCSLCRPGGPGVVGTSPQGLGMVNVEYVPPIVAAPTTIAGWPVPSVYIQWKGTDACLDFHCECGNHGHIDADFVYGVRCSACGRTYTLPDTLTLAEGVPDNELVQNVDTEPWPTR